jgi:hypothetical protein
MDRASKFGGWSLDSIAQGELAVHGRNVRSVDQRRISEHMQEPVDATTADRLSENPGFQSALNEGES